MGVLPTTTCRRCHRTYSSMKSRCPYCGTRKEKRVHSSKPVADSSVNGTTASRRKEETVSWQKTIGSVLVVLVLLVTIVMVGSTLKQYVQTDESKQSDVNGDGEAAATPVPTSSPEPTPEPTQVAITSLVIYYNGKQYDDLTTLVGEVLDFSVTVYPANLDVEVTWSSTDESVATVDEDGVVTVVGTGNCVITAEAGGVTAECIVRGKSSW